MRIVVTTLYHDDGNHETELTVHDSEDAAKDDAYQIAVSKWDNVYCPEGANCGVSGCEGVPPDPTTLTRDAAIDAYFTHRGGEFVDIVTHDVDIPIATALGDWARRAQEALDLSYTQPLASSVFAALIEELLGRDNGAAR